MVWAIGISTLFVIIVLSVLLYIDAQVYVLQLLNWLDAHAVWAPIIFILMMAGVVILLLPGVMFTTGAGFLFGVIAGSLYVIVGTTLGAVLAFLIARYLFGTRAAQYLLRHEKLKLIEEKFATQGGRIVLLTRLVPFFPAKLANYFFGLTSCPLRGFAFGTFFGIIPFSVHNVYLGAIAADLATLGHRETARTPLQWAFYLIGFMIAVAAVVYLSRLARRALADFTDETDGE